jgi:AcrR family transcriptional regulator
MPRKKMTKSDKMNPTALKILQAAEELFLAKGFEGTSGQDIANKAKVNKSLIYHHFQSKENLWKTVKLHVHMAKSGKPIDESIFPKDSYKNFLTAYITLRYDLFRQNPKIVRLLGWQRMEDDKLEMQGLPEWTFAKHVAIIKAFQDAGEVNPDIDPEMIVYFTMTSAIAPFMEEPEFFIGKSGEANKKKYLEMMISSIYKAFSTGK